MSDGKANYERAKARREYADLLRQAHQIGRRREDVLMQIQVMATVLSAFGKADSPEDSVRRAAQIYRAAAAAAHDIVPDEVKMEDDPNG